MACYEEDWSKYQVIPGITLKQEQLEGIDFFLRHYNCILNLQTGTGKTFTALVSAYMTMKKNKDTVCFIICPKVANSAFKKDISKTGWKYSIVTTEERHVDNEGRFFIFNYSNLDPMEKLLRGLVSRGFRIMAIFDEIHLLGTGESNVDKRLNSLRGLFTSVTGLSGTPLLNDIKGLYNIVNYVKPGFFGKWWEFKANWCVVNKRIIRVGGRRREIEEIVGYKNIDQLRELLKKVIITRGRDYPVKFYYRDCTLTERESSNYEIAAKGILDNTRDEKAMAARLWDLQRIADGSSKFIKNDLYSKMKLLLVVSKEIIDRDEGLIVYTELEDTYTVLGKLFKAYRGYLGYSNLYYITGKTKYEDRIRCEKCLKKRDVVIITKAGSRSINLQAVNNVVFYDLPFAVGDFLQAVGRIARTDSVYDVMNVYMLEVKETIDSYKRLLLQNNMGLIQQLFGQSSTMPYYGDVDKDLMKKYRQYFKNKFLWCRV